MLGIQHPWKITNVTFDKDEKQLDIYVECDKEASFPYQNSETHEIEYCKVYDTVEKKWRHLNFFENVCYIHGKVHRIQVPSGETEIILPPWCGKEHAFTLDFK